MGNTIAALRATDSIEEADAKVKNNRDSSCVNSFPALPAGTLKAVYSPVYYLKVSSFQGMRKVLSVVNSQQNVGVFIGWEVGSCCGYGGHEIGSVC